MMLSKAPWQKQAVALFACGLCPSFRLLLYASEHFKRHSPYPTTNAAHVHAVIAMCLGFKRLQLSDAQIIDSVNRLPNAYRTAWEWNVADYDKRAKDGSLTFAYFHVCVYRNT